MGLFGIIGPTAHFCLLDVGKPKAGETLVVSAAAGAVGSLVGQIGKIKGCWVIGIAGSDEKIRWITDELGFDAAINYKEHPIHESLKANCPDGIDVYFDNVGGKILDAVLNQINIKARFALCGLISQYKAVEPVPGTYNLARVLIQRRRVEGFVVIDYMDRFQEAYKKLEIWLAEGKIKYQVDIIDGLEKAALGIDKLFDGSKRDITARRSSTQSTR